MGKSIMNCDQCKGVDGSPIEMVPIYVKNHRSRMNMRQTQYSQVGMLCPLCKKVELTVK